jgi:hypothetical protein
MSKQERYIDVAPANPTVKSGVRDALLRASRSASVSPDFDRLPRNRAEARAYLRGRGPHMRFRYEVGDDGVRRGVRVRV